jgi:hypothetical protein
VEWRCVLLQGLKSELLALNFCKVRWGLGFLLGPHLVGHVYKLHFHNIGGEFWQTTSSSNRTKLQTLLDY